MHKKVNNLNNGNGTKNKLLNTALNHLNRVKISQKNKDTILNFVKYLSAQDLTKDRQSKYIYTTIQISRRIKNKDFSKLNKNDIENLVGEINNSDYSEWTKRDYKIVIKRLIKYVKEKEGKRFIEGRYPLEVSWINATIKKSRKKLPKELLTIDDIKKLAEGTLNLRDKAFILFLYESGARIGEVLNIKINDVEPDKYGARVTLFGKTGARKIRVIASAPAISNWIKHHPTKKYRSSWLFCSLNHPNMGDQGQYFYFNKLLRVTKERVNLSKPVNPHHFRHSRATELAKKITEAQLCNYMGWIIGSKEASTYVHLSGRDTEKAILKLHGLAEEETDEDNFSPIKCPRCGIKNDPGSRLCAGCSLGLDDKAMLEFENQNHDYIEEISILKDQMKKLQDYIYRFTDKIETDIEIKSK